MTLYVSSLNSLIRYRPHLCVMMLFVLVLPGCAVKTRAPEQFQFRDGAQAIYYQVEKSGQMPTQPERKIDNLMFVISGSDCISMGPFLPQYFTGFGEEAGSSRILILHKRHILANSDVRPCRNAFVRDDHLLRWQQDQAEFMASQLAALEQAGTRPKRIILLGISEGAELVPLLAQQFPVTHVVLLSHSGLNAMDAYRALAARYPHMQQGWQQLQTALAQVPEDPDGDWIHGRSWRYWAEIAALRQSDNLLGLNIPVFLAIGEADPVIITTAVDELQHRFDANGKHIHISRFPAADHGLRAGNKDYLPDLMHQVDNWLLEAAY